MNIITLGIFFALMQDWINRVTGGNKPVADLQTILSNFGAPYFDHYQGGRLVGPATFIFDRVTRCHFMLAEVTDPVGQLYLIGVVLNPDGGLNYYWGNYDLYGRLAETSDPPEPMWGEDEEE